MISLIDCYFMELSIHFPLLHRPTFEGCVESALHLEDEGFASLLLLVCAIGARFSYDKRVLSEGTDNWHSAGWKWFSLVAQHRKAINLRLPRLYDIQIPCVRRLKLRFCAAYADAPRSSCSLYSVTCTALVSHMLRGLR